MRTFVMGDLHGAYRAMQQVFEKVNFDYANDRLIQIGDVVDGWPDSVECVEELMKIRNLIAIRGNHDCWLYDWLAKGFADEWWPEFGGKATMASYHRHRKQHDQRHLLFFEKQKDYFVDEQQRLFVHAGYDPSVQILLQPSWYFYGSRKYWELMMRLNGAAAPQDVNRFTEVFIGHTQTIKYADHDQPVNIHHLWNLDTGCKGDGRLTLMNVETKAYVQSDPVFLLYPEFAV